MLALSIATLLYVVARSAAVSLPFETRPRTFQPVHESLKDASTPFNFSQYNGGALEVIYMASLTVGGAEFQVQLDTGSSDLWLDTANLKPSGTQDTGLNRSITYFDQSVAAGSILISNATFGDFTVPQAFISAPGSNATNNDTGLLGVGPPKLSKISATLNATVFNGATLLENIFAANPSEPNYITFQLSRSESMGTTSGGTFTIGELNSTLSGISSAPKLDVVTPDKWIIFVDGIIVNGKNVTGNSRFNMTGQGPTQTLAYLDTGTSLAVIPRVYADAIYSSVPGAFFFAAQNAYVVPCDTKIDLSFVFGGVAYPVHPIDTVNAFANGTAPVCFGAFTVPSEGHEPPAEDFVLGDSFLRNVYSLYDFGSFISGTTPPFIQLLSTTDASAADSEFAALSAQRNASITGTVPSTGGGAGSGGGGSGSGAGSGTGGKSGASRSTMLSTAILSAIAFGVVVVLN
ncbi:acid protease [Rickenella mellea]|uniref:Acid protease n=1 Tax=Rickenella mellea TaxID=50990 RepID=A0A4Y7PTU7_9AGAM|nr:acid protease [Rickenella mellea]